MTISVLCLGAGQDVGRSCVVVSLSPASPRQGLDRRTKTVMFDCGMHMSYDDARRFPDFATLRRHDITIDALVITHFHLDHCGALPHYVEQVGYAGPILMTEPTRSICPILLEDYRTIATSRTGEQGFFTTAMIASTMARVQTIGLNEPILIDDIEFRAFYAGHVLGAAMFWASVGDESVLYTGDYNTTPDRHLAAASCPFLLRPTLLITESTYATTIRDSKRSRERDFLRKVHACLERGGKVLVPVFALGRVQELCLLVESYWERMRLGHIPVYFSAGTLHSLLIHLNAGMAEKANEIYRRNTVWMSEHVQQRAASEVNLFDFKHIRPFERHLADAPGPMLVFASPGMLHSGTSLEIFKLWASNPANMLVIPGYCSAGTVGARVLAGHRSLLLTDPVTGIESTLEVRMQITNLSFSAHADSKGILQMIGAVQPEGVVLVHGERSKMVLLREQVEGELGIPCFDPANGEGLRIHPAASTAVDTDERAKAIEQAELEAARTANDPQVDYKTQIDALLMCIRSSTTDCCSPSGARLS